MTIKITIDEINNDERLDYALANLLDGYTRSRVVKLIDSSKVKINGNVAQKASKTVKEGDYIEIDDDTPTELKVLPQDIPLDIVFQDEYLAVINKQQGLTVHPSGSICSNTLVNALLYHIKDLSGINGILRPGIVHRLDKDTSGLMLVAKCDKAHVGLAKQIETKQCKRTYVAVVEGVIKEDCGVVDKAIARSVADRKKMEVNPLGRKAVTNYRVLERFEKNTFVEFVLQTGRTHQIRVHTKYLGFPIVGDKAYGFKKQRFNLDGQLLHSCKIEFTHPVTQEQMSFTAPLPQYFERVLAILRKENRV